MPLQVDEQAADIMNSHWSQQLANEKGEVKDKTADAFMAQMREAQRELIAMRLSGMDNETQARAMDTLAHLAGEMKVAFRAPSSMHKLIHASRAYEAARYRR